MLNISHPFLEFREVKKMISVPSCLADLARILISQFISSIIPFLNQYNQLRQFLPQSYTTIWGIQKQRGDMQDSVLSKLNDFMIQNELQDWRN